MKLLYLGDIVGRSGRDVVIEQVPKLRAQHGINFVVVNGENAAGGFGINPNICHDLYKCGVDVIVTGNHVWDQQDIIPFLSQNDRILRPYNFPPNTPGKGIGFYLTSTSGLRIVVLQLMGQVFMHENLECPFAAADKALEPYKLGANADCILVDMHCEANSEKTAMGHYLDGRVTAVIGTHTHIPTADARILKGGTAYQTDTGMCGDYDSVIGMEKEGVLRRFTTKITKGNKMEAAKGPATLCGILIETDSKTGLAKAIETVKIGGVLDARNG